MFYSLSFIYFKVFSNNKIIIIFSNQTPTNINKNMINLTANGIIGHNNQRKFFRKKVQSKIKKISEITPDEYQKSIFFESSIFNVTEGFSPKKKKAQTSPSKRK